MTTAIRHLKALIPGVSTVFGSSGINAPGVPGGLYAEINLGRLIRIRSVDRGIKRPVAFRVLGTPGTPGIDAIEAAQTPQIKVRGSRIKTGGGPNKSAACNLINRLVPRKSRDRIVDSQIKSRSRREV